MKHFSINAGMQSNKSCSYKKQALKKCNRLVTLEHKFFERARNLTHISLCQLRNMMKVELKNVSSNEIVDVGDRKLRQSVSIFEKHF